LPKDRHEALNGFAGAMQWLVPQLQLDNEQVWAPFMQSTQPEKEFPQQLI
jgi:dynein heavy chain 2